jgi:hypothetical protein
MTIIPHEHLTEDATDEQIARAIAGHLLNTFNPGGPYKLGYDYRDRTQPPKVKADKLVHKHAVAGIERKDKEQARAWIVECILAGLVVRRYIGEGWNTFCASGSITGTKRDLNRKFNPPKQKIGGNLDDDDSVPF